MTDAHPRPHLRIIMERRALPVNRGTSAGASRRLASLDIFASHMAAELATLGFSTATAFEKWLSAHHATSAGLWLRIAKAGAGVKSVTYAEALDVALCYGWIDGQKGAIDAQYWRQRFTPRRPSSKWSKINCAKAEALVAAGRMKAPGLAQMEAARKNGAWEAAYAGQRTAQVPEDLAAAIDENPAAKAAFGALDRVNRYAILYRVGDAKREATRAARIAKFVSMLAKGGKLYP